jgi:tetraacyldisaccharide 4'-kinase
MNVNSIFLTSFRIVLFPAAFLYGLIIKIRNFLFDKGWLQSVSFNFPIICVGNIAVGGTGKSPMTEYLIALLERHKLKPGTLSRGYKRKTKGYALANKNTTALDIGDEPMQFYLKFPEAAVAVSEERLVGIPQLLQDRPNLDAIILDDGFQHRAVKAGLNILLTEYGNLYTHDFFLPTGDLRDERKSAERSRIILVTKCPLSLSLKQKEKVIATLKPKSNQKIYFTTIAYGKPYHIIKKQRRKITNQDEILLICGIANPKPVKELLLQKAATYYQKDYSDHHIFSIDDLNDILHQFNKIQSAKKFMLTTEKDAVRLVKFAGTLQNYPMFVLPIKHTFLFNEGHLFDEQIVSFVKHFQLNQKNEREEIEK